jgi:hypothetical protein
MNCSRQGIGILGDDIPGNTNGTAIAGKQKYSEDTQGKLRNHFEHGWVYYFFVKVHRFFYNSVSSVKVYNIRIFLG